MSASAAPADAPWIRVTAVPGEPPRVDGVAACALGHRLPDGDGIFARWDFDGTRLVVETDRYGFYPLYLHVAADGVAVSPSIPRLLAAGARRDLDLDALAAFLHVGFFLADETPFRAVRAVPPGGRVVWTAAGIASSGGPFLVPPATIGRDAALDGYVELFRTAVRRRAPHGRVVLPLSGGRDSRHLLFELVAAGVVPATTVTARHFPPRPDEDAEIAPRVAAAVGVPHVVLAQGDELAAETSKNLATGLCADEHAWLLVLADFLAGYDTVYDGIGGDVLSAGLFLNPARVEAYACGRYEEVAGFFLQPRAAATLARLLVPELRARLSPEHARARVAAALAEHAAAANPIGSFAFWNRTRREIALAPYALYPRTLTVHAPYLDAALYDFLAALPIEILVDHAFHTDAIARACPEHAALAYERGDRWPPARPHDRRFAAALRASKRFWGRRRGLLLADGAAPRLRIADALDGWRHEPAQLQPRLALYLADLEDAVRGQP